MPRSLNRLLISILIILHGFIITLAMLGHRGASFLHDDFLSWVAPYTALGNWKADTNRMPIASSNALEEIVQVEWHMRDAANDRWETLIPKKASHRIEDTATLNRRERFEERWLHQLSGLLVYENDEGAGRMLMTALRNALSERQIDVDKVRVTVAPRLSQQQYGEIQASDDPSKLPEFLQPQVAYAASVIDLGDGQLSLLRQTEARRASKTLTPSESADSKDGVQQ